MWWISLAVDLFVNARITFQKVDGDRKKRVSSQSVTFHMLKAELRMRPVAENVVVVVVGLSFSHSFLSPFSDFSKFSLSHLKRWEEDKYTKRKRRRNWWEGQRVEILFFVPKERVRMKSRSEKDEQTEGLQWRDKKWRRCKGKDRKER